MRTAFGLVLVSLTLSTVPQAQTNAALEVRFIGNMAYAISDGTTTLFSDFPYESGYGVYMEYDARDLQSRTARSLALITHRHGDHWDKPLFDRTDWHVVGPTDAVSGVPAARLVRALPVAPARQNVSFGDISIDALPTPHAAIGHYSYLVTWHGRRLYFTGDTDDTTELLAAKNVDVAFVSPWLFQAARKSGHTIDAKRIVIYHQQARETSVPGCVGTCSVPRQGATFRLDR